MPGAPSSPEGTADTGKVPPRPGTRPSARSSAPPRPSGRPGSYAAGRPGGRPAARGSARQLAQRRQRNVYMVTGGSALVVIVIGVIIAVSLTGNGSGGGGKTTSSRRAPAVAPGTYALPAVLLQKVERLPLNALVSAARAQPSGTTPPQPLPATNKVLSSNGKPEVLYIGDEWCPYCAAERWALVMALSKFGTFGPLRGTTSSSTDVNASSPTFSFYRVKYTSKYLAFVAVERQATNGSALQSPTKAQQALFTKWDAPPYVSAQQAPGIPFVYLGGKYLQVGTQFDGAAIAGTTFSNALKLLTAGTNSTSKGLEASAGYLVGDLCAITHLQPTSVCSHVPAQLIGINTSSPRK